MLVTVSEQCEKKLLAVKQEEKSGTTHVGLSSELNIGQEMFLTLIYVTHAWDTQLYLAPFGVKVKWFGILLL